MLKEVNVRKIDWVCSEIHTEAGKAVTPSVRKAAALVVLPNPALGAKSDAEALQLLAKSATVIGEAVMPQLIELLSEPVISYGKAAIVGLQGDLEHGAGMIHPTLGAPMRAAIGGGTALIPSALKVAVAGTPIDVPLGHRNDSWSFDEIDTFTVCSADAPRPSEIMLVIALASAGRPHARVKKA